MKKVFVMFLCALCGVMLVSCGRAAESDTENVTKPAAEISETTAETSEATTTSVTDVTTDEVTTAEITTTTPQTTTRPVTTTKHTQHVFAEWKTVKEPDCVNKGSKERECLMCGYKETQELPPKEHTFGEWAVTKAASCTESGVKARKCSVCGKTEEAGIDAVGHKFGDWQTTKAATYETTGERVRKCGVCGLTQSEVIPVKVLTDADKQAMAREVAQEIADSIEGDTDLEKVSQAAAIVAWYSGQCNYTMEGKDYATAYGVFIKGEYSCAGSTRALGLVLECMGYKWQHANENQYTHQWCILTMDGQVGYADGQVGWAGYGKHPVAE